jgi:hypothetical protein
MLLNDIYIYSLDMYSTYIRPLLVQARTSDYALSRVAQVATQVQSLELLCFKIRSPLTKKNSYVMTEGQLRRTQQKS